MRPISVSVLRYGNKPKVGFGSRAAIALGPSYVRLVPASRLYGWSIRSSATGQERMPGFSSLARL